ncbi:agamous MADS-box protein AGL80 [Trifolium repens]|nr:agamous MADS-box protein AGL80 [Trifolium repens]
MEQVKTLCGLEACALVLGPGDTKPSIWPSEDIAKDLINKFESFSSSVQSKNRIDQLIFLKDKEKKLESNLAKINKGNEEILMGFFMKQIINEGKSFNDFDINQKNCLISFMLEKIKIARKGLRCAVLSLNNLPPPPPMSCYLDNGNMIDLGINQVDHMGGSGVDNNSINNIGLIPISNLSGSDDLLVHQGNLGSGKEISPQVNSSGGVEVAFSYEDLGDFNCNMEIPSYENSISYSIDDMFLSQENLGGFDNNIGGNMGIAPHANPSGVDLLPPQDNFEGNINNQDIGNNLGNNIRISPHENSRDGINMLFPQENFGDQCDIQSYNNNMWLPSHANPSGHIDSFLSQGNYGGQGNLGCFDNNASSNMWIPPQYENPSGGNNMMIHHQNNFQGNTNGEGTEIFNANFDHTNYGSNFIHEWSSKENVSGNNEQQQH